MRIGINSLFLVSGKGGGIERYLRGLVGGLKKIDKKNEYFIFTNRNCRGAFGFGENFHEIYCDVSAVFRPAKILWEQFVLPWQLKRHKIDILLSAGNTAPVAHRCPSVAIIYDMIPFIRPEGFNTIELLALKTLFSLTAKTSSKIITISKSSQEEIVKRLKVSPDKVEIVYGSCDEYFKPVGDKGRSELQKYGISGEYILYVASSRPYKNIDGLIKAYRIMKERHHMGHKLVVVGLAGRAYPELMKLVKESKLEGDVIFCGFVNDEDLPLLYSLSYVFVYPSFYEGFGLPILEAMSCGVPVAASHVTSIPEAVGNAGLLFDPYNVEEMAEVIYRLMIDRGLRESLIQKGYEWVKEFSWEKSAMRVLAVLSDTYTENRMFGRGI